MTNQNTPVTGTVYAYLCPPVLCLLKSVTHVCAIKMAEDWLGAHSASSHGFHEFKPQYGKKKMGNHDHTKQIHALSGIFSVANVIGRSSKLTDLHSLGCPHLMGIYVRALWLVVSPKVFAQAGPTVLCLLSS
jgi:hypothetical protein